MKTAIALGIDDNEDDQFLLQRAWKKAAPPLSLQLAGDGEKAIEYLAGEGKFSDRAAYPIPEILLLDLKMPRKNGFEVLEWIKKNPGPSVPAVAVFTSSQNTADIERSYELGAKWFLIKPVEYTELVEFIRLLGRWVENPEGNDLSLSPHHREAMSN
ncbi:MAG: response regulator [Methylacidiphilales bacterium]|nr:response regulator [Candidatus Methylacidiphilales bacterium]